MGQNTLNTTQGLDERIRTEIRVSSSPQIFDSFDLNGSLGITQPTPALPHPHALPPDYSFGSKRRSQLHEPHAPHLVRADQTDHSFESMPSSTKSYTLESTSKESSRDRSDPSIWSWWARKFQELYSRASDEWWAIEIIAWVVSAMCISLIALLLGIYDGHPVPSEWPLGITLNAYISILSAIGKYALAVPVDEALGQLKWVYFAKKSNAEQKYVLPRKVMEFEVFDKASRGPWGALILIFRLRFRTIASIGASITILSLALDPFFQQVVTYPQRPRSFGKSSITRVVNCSPSPSDNKKYSKNGTTYSVAPNTIQTLVDSHLKGDGSSYFSPPVFCPSDDCKWPRFQTLGICSRCEDLSQLLTKTCLWEPGDWRSNSSRFTDATNFSWSNSCGYFMNASSELPVLMAGHNVNSNGSVGEALAGRLLPLHDLDLNENYWGGSPVPANASSFMDTKPVMEECALTWCVKTIESTFTNGTLTEKVVSTFQNDSQPVRYPFTFVNASHDPSHLDRYYYWQSYSITPPGQNTTFTISNDTVFNIMAAFYNWFPGFLTVANESTLPSLRYNNRHGGLSLSIQSNLSTIRPPGNISENMEYFATALTDAMRGFAGTTETVFGTGSFETYVHVRWAWFCLPVILLVATILFLLAAIIHSSKSVAGIWKTSSVATLMHGLSWEAKKRGDGSVWTMNEMTSRAKDISVYLDEEKEGGTLNYIDPSSREFTWNRKLE